MVVREIWIGFPSVQVQADNMRTTFIDDRLECVISGDEDEKKSSESEAESVNFVFLLLHPHPKLGGDLDNNVVACVSRDVRSSLKKRAITIRMNTRGVGRSKGWSSFSGTSEREDVKAGVAFARREYPSRRLVLVAYSFGAVVACSILPEIRHHLSGLVIVAYPKSAMTWPLFLPHFLRGIHDETPSPTVPPLPKLLLIGDADEFASVSTIKSIYDNDFKDPKTLQVYSGGVTHFFLGCESLVSESVVEWVRRTFPS